MSNSFIFYESFAEALRDIPAEQYKAIFTAICDYALHGEMPEGLDPISNAIFTLIKPQLDANNKRRENGKKGASYGNLGGRPKNETPEKPQENPKETPNKPQGNPNQTPNVNVNDNENVNVNENVNENENVKEKAPKGATKKTRFARPSVEEVRAYCNERGNGIDPEAFIDFYESKGWKVGSEPMKDWRAAVRTWEKRRNNTRSPSSIQERAENAMREVASWV